jgi:two-component system, NarL family, invasion response regulator UvrY
MGYLHKSIILNYNQPKEMINILIADDHETLRTGLKIFISDFIDHSVVDEAWDGDTTFKKIKEKDYQLIILDVNMPGRESFTLVGDILSLKPKTNILIFTMNPEDLYAKKYLQLGVKGYLNKTATEKEIKKAIDNVINSKRYISSALVESLTEEALGNKSGNPFDSLSHREFEILRHILKGEDLDEICSSLNLQPSTVGTYKARIFHKLNCKNIIGLNQLARIHNVTG